MPELFTPITIDGLKLKNRIIMPPMARDLSTTDGKPTSELYDHYLRRAKDVGLVIVEHSYVQLDGKLSEKQLGIYKDELTSPLNKLSDSIKGKGTPSCIQITHAGAKARKEIIGQRPKAPSSEFYDKEVDKLSVEEMEEIKKNFVEAAVRAEKAGFDSVEVHGAHGFLLSEFVSPLSNTRDDKYGGDLRNRIRFPLEIVEEIIESVKDLKVFYRLGASDRMKAGFEIDEAKVLAKNLEKKGIDAIDVSGGLCGSAPSELEGKQGYFVPLAEKIKKAVDVPVIGVGGIKDPAYANKIIREGRVDLIAVGRALLKNPDWAAEAKKKLKG